MPDTILDSFVAGIPCKIQVLTYHKQPPWRGGIMSCPSDVDWYGYTEIEFAVLDRRGRPAPWLERKLTDEISNRIECEIEDALSGNEEGEEPCQK